MRMKHVFSEVIWQWACKKKQSWCLLSSLYGKSNSIPFYNYLKSMKVGSPVTESLRKHVGLDNSYPI
uniref:Uncharacterized protein n=1 Tax=Anguilla anguilla TaxID=7936 RepID=A0A0E9U9H6_ANGAN